MTGLRRLSSLTSPSTAGRRTAGRKAAAHDRLHAGEARSGLANGRLDGHGQLIGTPLQHGREQLVLGGEPVQDRLLAHSDRSGDVVE